MEVKVQKLSVKLKNSPTNASQVCSSENLQLNKDESLSVVDKVRTDNNPEVNLQLTNNQCLQQKVFVLSLEGLPLMPTKPSRARKMIKSGKVNVGDLFWVKGIKYICKGMCSYGTQIMYKIMEKRKYFNFKFVTKIFHFGSLVWNI